MLSPYWSYDVPSGGRCVAESVSLLARILSMVKPVDFIFVRMEKKITNSVAKYDIGKSYNILKLFSAVTDVDIQALHYYIVTVN